VTSYFPSAAKNLGLDTEVPHDERYQIADEYLDVTYISYGRDHGAMMLL
jgi:alkanesulfonate monooxygenase SsuD/methylene tetrahydromethanopterin reductase-like flavin-dependent oxidoreductase (luciferase family)